MASNDNSYYVLRSINVELDGPNYLYWRKSMTSVLKGMSLWKIVTGESTKPKLGQGITEADIDRWEQRNHYIISLIRLNCVRGIAMTIKETDSAKEVWDILETTYLQKNTAWRFQLEHDLRQVRQEPNQGIPELLAQLNILWEKYYLTLPTTLLEHAEFKKFLDESMLFQFLYALHDNFESVRANILQRSPLPTVNDVVPELLAEQTRKTRGVEPSMDSAMAAQSRPPHPQSRPSPSAGVSKFCNYCKKSGHWKSECLRLKRKNQGQNPRAAAVDSAPPNSVSDAPVTMSQLHHVIQGIVENTIHQINNKDDGNIAASASRSGIASAFLWYLDSGASNHMCFNRSLFTQLHPLVSKNNLVHTADNSSVLATHKGTIQLGHLLLHDVLFVPKLSLNLISISQLCDQGLTVKFTPSTCLIQAPGERTLCGRGLEVENYIGWNF